MAINPLSRGLVDPMGGERDLAAGVIRAVGVAAERFGEDGLRVMRAVRFAAVLELDLEPETEAAIEPAIPVFRKVSQERVRDELLKLMGARRPSTGLELMRTTGLLDEVLPELSLAVGLKQNRYHPHDVYVHTLRVVDCAPPDDVLRLAALLHDIGKPPTCKANPRRPGENSFHNHEVVGAEMARALCARLRLSNRDRDRVEALIRAHNFPLEGWRAPGLRRFLRQVGVELLEDLFALKRADILGKEDDGGRLLLLDALWDRLQEELARAPALSTRDLAVDGRRLMTHLGLKPGPWLGVLLRALLERVIEQPELNEVGVLLELAERLQREDSE